MKKLIITVIFLSCIKLSLWAGFGIPRIEDQWSIPNVICLDYERLYQVNITVDTTMCLRNIDSLQESKMATVPFKIHCEFNVFYVWKGNYLVRFLVSKYNKIEKNEANELFNVKYLFDANTFNEIENNETCFCYQSNSGYGGDGPSGPINYAIKSKLGLIEEDSIALYKFYDIQVLRCNPSNKTDTINPLFYYNYKTDFDDSRANFYDDTTIIEKIKNHIYQNLFTEGKINYNGISKCFLFPAFLPVDKKLKQTFYANCSDSEEKKKIIVNEIYNVSNKAIYQIENQYPLEKIDITYLKRYIPNKLPNEMDYDFLYIPHVMYMPLGDFKYKIKSINGQPLNQFMAGYVDDFKPTLLQSTGTERYSKICEIAEVKVQPSFPGGQDSLLSYQSRNLSYPSSAREAGVEGHVIIRFIVNKDSTISNVELLRSLDPACDEAAVKLVKNMPKWIPGKQGDKPVRVRMTIPVVFKINN